jgi:hypothetical protein
MTTEREEKRRMDVDDYEANEKEIDRLNTENHQLRVRVSALENYVKFKGMEKEFNQWTE